MCGLCSLSHGLPKIISCPSRGSRSSVIRSVMPLYLTGTCAACLLTVYGDLSVKLTSYGSWMSFVISFNLCATFSRMRLQDDPELTRILRVIFLMTPLKVRSLFPLAHCAMLVLPNPLSLCTV